MGIPAYSLPPVEFAWKHKNGHSLDHLINSEVSGNYETVLRDLVKGLASFSLFSRNRY